MNSLLHYQADRIEMALAAHGLRGVHVTSGDVGPRWVRLALALPYGVRPAAVIRLQDDLANKLGTSLRVVQDGAGQVFVEIPHEQGYAVSILRLVEASRHAVLPMVAMLGVSIEGQPLLLRLTSPTVSHALVVGVTGAGKTVLARSIILSLAAFNSPGRLQLLLIDPKGTKFQDLASLPHLLTDVIVEAGHGVHVLGELERLMVERDKGGIADPRIVVVVDELADLVMSDAGIMQPITRLAQRGREAGIHLILCTQKPTSDVLGRLAKANFPVRLVGSVTTPEEAKIASGIAQTGAERLLGRGDFLLITQGRVEARFQAANASREAAQMIIARIRAEMAGQAGVQRERRWEPPDLRLVVDNRGVETDARRVLRTPGWIEQWWDKANQRFNYGHLSAIGRIIQREVEGAGYRYVSQVSDTLRALLLEGAVSNPLPNPPPDRGRELTQEER